MLALLLDRLLGEPQRWHPLVGFGRIADSVESSMNRSASTGRQFCWGVFAWLIVVLVPAAVSFMLVVYASRYSAYSVYLLDIIVLYFAIAYRSLGEHARAVLVPLCANDIALARQQLARIVSRDTERLDAQAICKATIESVLENGSDAIFAPIVWYLIGGLPAVVVYRLSNTLDAMWGYKTPRFLFFGRFAARMDDILNWLPARLVAISYALLGQTLIALRCWRQQAALLASPNAGVVMAAGAGALSLQLGGSAYYGGEWIDKPLFGGDRQPQNQDLMRSVALLRKTVFLWCLVMLLCCVL